MVTFIAFLKFLLTYFIDNFDQINYKSLLNCLREKNAIYQNEIQTLKNRNNRLIEQLREKSMHASLLQAEKSQLETEVFFLLILISLNKFCKIFFSLNV